MLGKIHLLFANPPQLLLFSFMGLVKISRRKEKEVDTMVQKRAKTFEVSLPTVTRIMKFEQTHK